MFAHPPTWAWYVAIANLTTWVNWPAWAAVFTFLALLNTARLADRANRAERRQQAVFLFVVIEALRVLPHVICKGEFKDVWFYFGVEVQVDGSLTLLPDTKELIARRSQRAPLDVFEVPLIVTRDHLEETKAWEEIEEFRTIDFPSVLSVVNFRNAKNAALRLRSKLSEFDGDYEDALTIWGEVQNITSGLDGLNYVANERGPYERSEWRYGREPYLPRLLKELRSLFR